jgi:UDP-N-acetylmuramoyl-L-alanyl-D-glutamate--2,6-diaminopimelate ligase
MKNLIKKILPKFFINFYHFLLAFFSAILYGFPSRKIKLIGVTGTNGKTTTTEMIASILEAAGYKVALLNSVRFKIGEEETINTLRMTMPGRGFIQKFLKKALKNNCSFAVIEVSSEGIKQYRHKFLNFKIAIFTNLAPEHIESHGSFENYRRAKGKFFEATKKIHVLNAEDENVEYFMKFPAKKKIFYSTDLSKNLAFQKIGTIIFAENIRENEKGTAFKVNNVDFNLGIIGKFNIYNALAAISVGISQGISLETCKKALESFKGVPGRMEEVISKPFKVIVDYAFTPNALEKVYQTLTSQITTNDSRLICVLGACGGGRDKWKRPVLGELAAKYCDEVIVTNEDPYDEDPWQIIEQVASGTKGKARKILDRREAISTALKLAKEGDVVVITGKGCEPSICVKGKKIPWDDREVAREEFQKLNDSTTLRLND